MPMRRIPSSMPVVASTRKMAMAFVSDAIQILRVSSSNFEISKEISKRNSSPKSTIKKGISRCSKRYTVIFPVVNSLFSLREIFRSDIRRWKKFSVGIAICISRPVQYCSRGKSCPTRYASIILKVVSGYKSAKAGPHQPPCFEFVTR